MREEIKTVLSLFVITLLSGLLLGGVYGLTKEPIERANRAALYASYEELVPGGKDYAPDEAAAEAANAALSDQRFGSVTIDGIVKVLGKDQETLGYVVTVTSHEAYDGDLQLAAGYTEENGTLRSSGIGFLSISETVGLGLNAQNPEFKDQFVGKSTDALSVTKNGNAGEQEINALSGATITSRAVTNAVNAAGFAVSECVKR